MKAKIHELQPLRQQIVEDSKTMNINQVAEKYNTCYYNAKKIIDESTPSLIFSYEKMGLPFIM
jgi:hypothetical protein